MRTTKQTKKISRPKHLFILLLLFLTSMCGLTATAQESNPTENRADSLTEDSLSMFLPEVMVKGEQPVAKLERGRLTYNMQLLLERMPADNAFEALSNIPGVSVNGDDVNFASQAVTLIINGKASTMSQEQMRERLKQMPAEMVAKAEIMLSAPPQYHVRGAAINIITNDYIGQKHISGQLQATHKQSKYAGGKAGGNLLYSNEKLQIDASYRHSGGDSYGVVSHEALHPLNGASVEYSDRTQNKARSTVHDYRAGMDYQFAKDHTLAIAYTGNNTKYNSNNNTTGNSTSTQRLDDHDYWHNIDLDYTTPFGLKLTASYIKYKTTRTQTLDGRLNDTERDITADSYQNIKSWLVAADQTHSLANGWGISYGAKAQFTDNSSAQTTMTAGGDTLSDIDDKVKTTERIVNAYAGFSKQIGNSLSIEASVAAENYHTQSLNEWRIYPNLNVAWFVNERNTLNLSFGSNSTYPSYWSTMNSVNYSSAYSEIWGNPDLRPSSSYDLQLVWQYDRRYTLVAFAGFNPNFFVQLPYQPTDRMAVIMKEVNFDHRNRFGLQASAMLTAGEWLNANVFMTGIYTNDKCDDFFDLPFDRSKIMFSAGGTVSALLSRRANIRLMLNPFFQSKAIQGVYDINSVFILNASLRWESANGKWNITASGQNLTNDYFNTKSLQGNQNFGMDVCQNWISGSLTVTYKLGNYKSKDNKEVDISRMGY